MEFKYHTDMIDREPKSNRPWGHSTMIRTAASLLMLIALALPAAEPVNHQETPALSTTTLEPPVYHPLESDLTIPTPTATILIENLSSSL